MGSSRSASNQRCVQDPSANKSCSAHRFGTQGGPVLASMAQGPSPPRPPACPTRAPTLRSPPSSSSNSSSGARQSAAGHWARVTPSRDPPGARSTRSRAITPWARWRGGAAELSWPGRGRLYPRPEPQEAAPLPRRGWHAGGHVGGGLQGESLPHPRLARPGAPWPTLSSSLGCGAGQLPLYPMNRDPLPTPD